MTTGVTSNGRWDEVIRRSIRTVWHWVGFYMAVASALPPLWEALVIGPGPAIGGVPLLDGVAIVGTMGPAIGLSLLRPGVSAARTLAFGVITAVLLRILLVTFAGPDPALSGTLMVSVDVGLAVVAALSLAAAGALAIEGTGTRSAANE